MRGKQLLYWIGALGVLGLSLSLKASPATLSLTSPPASNATLNVTPAIAQNLEYAQKLNQQVSGDLPFYDETGKRTFLKEYFGKGPIILTLGYYGCASVCTVVFRETFQSLQALRWDYKAPFTLLFASIDPKEKTDLAAKKRRSYLKSYQRADLESATHFLVGPETSIKSLTDSVGFQYRYDEPSGQYVHPAGIVVLTPEGKVSKYLLGAKYEPRDLRFALIEASKGKVGSLVDKIMLFCFKYDPMQGRYGFVVMSAVRLLGLVTLFSLLGYIILQTVRERRRRGGIRVR